LKAAYFPGVDSRARINTFLLSFMNALNRTKMAKKHAGKWVALKGDRKTVIATGRSLRSARDAAKAKGHDQPILTRLPRTVRSFVGVLRA
jgi:hypothetical protein